MAPKPPELFVYLLNTKSLITIDYDESDSVSKLKDIIKAKKPYLKDIDADQLELYKPDAPFDDDGGSEKNALATVQKGLQLHRIMPLSQCSLSLVRNKIHLVAKVSDGSGQVVAHPLSSTLILDPLSHQQLLVPISFAAADPADWGDGSNLSPNEINVIEQRNFDLSTLPVSTNTGKIIGQLRSQRLLVSTQIVKECFALLKDLSDDKTVIEESLVLSEVTENSQLPQTSIEELIHYITIIGTVTSIDCFRVAKPAYFTTRFLDTIALQFQKRIDVLHHYEYIRNENWPFPFIANLHNATPPDPPRYSVIPRSDIQFRVHHFPVVIVEVESDARGELDRYRMLIQAACTVRLANSWISSEERPFILLAFYIDKSLQLDRYICFQQLPSGSIDEDNQVYCVKQRFDLTKPHEAFKFSHELFNLGDILCSVADDLKKFRQPMNSLKQSVASMGLPRFSAKSPSKSPSKKRKHDGGTDGRSRDSIPNDHVDNLYADDCCSISVSADDSVMENRSLEEWIPLATDRISSIIRYVHSGAPVVMKVVEADEEYIHSMLAAYKEPDNHTIPLIKVTPTFDKYQLLMPEGLALSKAILEKLANEGVELLAQQLLEGIEFMHRHNVVHLDLKTDNMVILGERLCIIDFGLARQLSGRNSTLKGFRGTKGWVAPEVGDDDGPEREYNPFAVDLWATGYTISTWIAGRGCHKLEGTAERLMHSNPIERLSYSDRLNSTPRGTKRRNLCPLGNPLLKQRFVHVH